MGVVWRARGWRSIMFCDFHSTYTLYTGSNDDINRPEVDIALLTWTPSAMSINNVKLFHKMFHTRVSMAT